MSKDDKMTQEDRALMGRYGITSASKMMYFYKEYRYENLGDALHHAKGETKRTHSIIPQTPTET